MLSSTKTLAAASPEAKAPPTVQKGHLSKPLLTVEEFGQALGGAIGRNSLYAFIKADRIKHVLVGKKYLILASEVIDFPLREAGEGVL